VRGAQFCKLLAKLANKIGMITSKPTQQFVPVKEIRDDVAILRSGEMRMVLMASSLNFALKSEDEQTAIIMQYQNFLNSLDFPVQIFIDSRKLNIQPYIDILVAREKEQINELLKIQTKEYIEFIKNFVASTNIVSKEFYIVVPYQVSAFGLKAGLLGGFFGKKKAKDAKNKETQFAENKFQLQQRADVVRGGLASMGIRAAALNTEELIELYLKLFNPCELEKGVIPQQAGEA
jgi:hypothetical protein